MRSRVRKFAHILERFGLALAGAASGLFVAIHVGSSVSALTSQASVARILFAMGRDGIRAGIMLRASDLPAHAITVMSRVERVHRAGLQGRVRRDEQAPLRVRRPQHPQPRRAAQHW